MSQDYRDGSLKYWEETHKKQNYDRDSIRVDDWLERFDEIILRTDKPVLDLGCGCGNDTLYLLDKGKKVLPCDQSVTAIENIKRNFPEICETGCFNMLDGFPYDNDSFDLIIADLCLHYFLKADTEKIIRGIKRILVSGGHLILRVNSVNDVNHGAGQGIEIEHNVYLAENGTLKRFFDETDIHEFFRDFHIEYINEEVMARYSLDKWLYTVCVRYV